MRRMKRELEEGPQRAAKLSIRKAWPRKTGQEKRLISPGEAEVPSLEEKTSPFSVRGRNGCAPTQKKKNWEAEKSDTKKPQSYERILFVYQ